MRLGGHTPAQLSSLAHGAVVELIADPRALDALREQWSALLEATGRWNPFLTWEWMSAWWTHLRDTATLNILTVRSGGRLIAIAPLMMVRRGLSVNTRLEFVGVGAGADYLDVIVHPDDEPTALAALATWLDARQLSLHLDHLPPSPVSARLWRELSSSRWTAIEASPDVCPFIDLSGQTWDSYLSSLGSSHRANVRRRLRALEAEFDVRFAAIESHDERRRTLEALFVFHDQRWLDSGGSTAFSTSSLRAFHHALTRSAFDHGWLRMYALSLNNTVAAAMYGFARDGRFYFFQHGADAVHAGYSLGLALMALTIRAAIDEGLREFDMLYGHESYKTLWARHQRPLGRLMLFPPRLAGRWLRRHAEAREAVRALVHRLGLKGSHDLA